MAFQQHIIPLSKNTSKHDYLYIVCTSLVKINIINLIYALMYFYYRVTVISIQSIFYKYSYYVIIDFHVAYCAGDFK